MPRELMTIQEIKELNELLRRVFNCISNLKSEHKLADKIKYPQIPSILTESLTLHLLKKSLILPELKEYEFNFGGRVADILASKGDEKKRIEVKATAKSGFEYFSEKDISADYIVWIHFADFFMNSKSTSIKVLIVRRPNMYFEKPRKITLTQLQQIIKSNLEEINIDINCL